METCLQNLLSKTAPLPWIITLAVTISFAGARFLLLSAQARTVCGDIPVARLPLMCEFFPPSWGQVQHVRISTA